MPAVFFFLLSGTTPWALLMKNHFEGQARGCSLSIRLVLASCGSQLMLPGSRYVPFPSPPTPCAMTALCNNQPLVRRQTAFLTLLVKLRSYLTTNPVKRRSYL